MIKAIREKLEAEINPLDYELRVTIPKDIKKALEFGDLRENAEYKAALERQEFVKARLGQLRSRMVELAHLDFSSLPHDRIAYGSDVTIESAEGSSSVFRLVMPEETDTERGWISVSSPIGRGLVGHEEGDEVEIRTPGGVKQWTILEVRTVHDQT